MKKTAKIKTTAKMKMTSKMKTTSKIKMTAKIMTTHYNRPLQTDYNPEIHEACQTGNGIVHEVCGIVRAPILNKDDINISEAYQTGNRIIHFKMLFAALRT